MFSQPRVRTEVSVEDCPRCLRCRQSGPLPSQQACLFWRRWIAIKTCCSRTALFSQPGHVRCCASFILGRRFQRITSAQSFSPYRRDARFSPLPWSQVLLYSCFSYEAVIARWFFYAGKMLKTSVLSQDVSVKRIKFELYGYHFEGYMETEEDSQKRLYIWSSAPLSCL